MEDYNKGTTIDSQKDVHLARGRRPKYESRATELRARLVTWKQIPESGRPSLRALARELGTSHQMLTYYLRSLDRWQTEERAKWIRARAKTEGREMTLRECGDAIIVPCFLRQIEDLRQAAKRGPLHRDEIKIARLLAQQRLPGAQELLEECLRADAKERKSFAAIVKETPRQEGETYLSWIGRIWDECEKYETHCPAVITEDLLQKCSSGIATTGKKNLPAEIAGARKPFKTM